MHSDICELIWLTFVVMKDTLVLLVLVLVFVTFTLVQGHLDGRKQVYCTDIS